MQTDKHFVIVTGMSGAGKTQTSKVLEDMGYFCVDNLPSPLISRFADLIVTSEGNINKVCLVVDLRDGSFLDSIDDALAYLHAIGIHYEIIFLDASDEVLVRRFKESRRSHPQSPAGSLLTGIQMEREALAYLRDRAQTIIDTSNLTNADLRQTLIDTLTSEDTGIQVIITSFGFKHGIPIDADIVMDVRFMANPYYVPELRQLTGRDPAVQAYIYDRPETQRFLRHFSDLILELLPEYIKEGKNQLSIGIGCTGGQHRSIAMAIALGRRVAEQGYEVTVNHRDH